LLGTDQESDIHCYSEVSIPTLNTENNSNTDNNNRAHYLESLAKTSTSQLLADLIKRVTIDPFTHIIPPLRAKESSNTDNTR
jgi:hypothetical protein